MHVLVWVYHGFSVPEITVIVFKLTIPEIPHHVVFGYTVNSIQCLRPDLVNNI